MSRRTDPWWATTKKQDPRFKARLKEMNKTEGPARMFYAMHSRSFKHFLINDPVLRRQMKRTAERMKHLIEADIPLGEGTEGHISKSIRLVDSTRYDRKAYARKLFSEHPGFGKVTKQRKSIDKVMRRIASE